MSSPSVFAMFGMIHSVHLSCAGFLLSPWPLDAYTNYRLCMSKSAYVSAYFVSQNIKDVRDHFW